MPALVIDVVEANVPDCTEMVPVFVSGMLKLTLAPVPGAEEIVPALLKLALVPENPPTSKLNVPPDWFVITPLAVAGTPLLSSMTTVPELIKARSSSRPSKSFLGTSLSMLTVPELPMINSPLPVMVPSYQSRVLPLPLTVMLPAPSRVAPYMMSVPETVDAEAIGEGGRAAVRCCRPASACHSKSDC